MIHIYIFTFLLLLIFTILFAFIYREKKYKESFTYNKINDKNRFEHGKNIHKFQENFENANIIEGYDSSKIDPYKAMEVPTDFPSILLPNWKISENIKGTGRTTWEPDFVKIWNGRWIYYGTVASYLATLDINTVKFLIIKLNKNGTGQIIDEYLNFTIDVINTGANILTGIIPSGEYKGYRAFLKLIPTDLKYINPSKSFPIKMRYYIEKDGKKFNLSSGNIYNMQGYSTKFIGDRLILANFLEASGIQTDSNLAFSSYNFNKINQQTYDQNKINSRLNRYNRLK
jgi:hypothetical protein